MGKKESSDELIVVDAERYKKVKKALEASQAGERSEVPPKLDEKESTRELVVIDVKRYKIVKKALAESEERYRQLFENVPIGIYRTTRDGHIVDANPALVKMLGFASHAELATRNLEHDSFEPGYERAAFIKLLERESEIKGLESTWKKKDGTLIYVRENAKLTHGQDGQVYFEGTVEDITQSKLAEEAQRTRTQQMEILNSIISAGNLAESMTEMLEKTLESMVEPLGFDTAGIYMYDAEARKVKLMARRGAPSQFYLLDEYMAIDNMPFSQVLLRGKPVFVENLGETLPDLAQKWGWRMACTIPLVSKGRIVGALGVASCQRLLFSVGEKNILELIGKEVGTLISKLQTEMALRESEKYYRTLIDTSPDIIVVMDLEGRLITVNQQFLKTGGYFYDQVIGKSTYDFVAGLDRLFLEKKTARFIENNKVSGSEYQFKKKDGQAIPLEVSASVLLDNASRPAGIIAIGRDITERKRAGEALRKSEEKFRSIAEQTSDLIAITDDAGVVSYASASALSLFKYEPGEMVGRNFMEFLDAPSVPKAVAAFRDDLDRGGKSVGLALTMKRKDGSTFAGELNGSSFQYGAQCGSLVVIRDVTERMRAQLDIEEKNRVLATLNEISLELASLPPAADINEYIAKKLMSISRAIYVGVNHYNKDTRQLEFARANTASQVLNEVNRVLGRNIGSVKYDISEAMYREITGEVVGYRRTLHEVSFGAISKKAGAIIQRVFNIDHFIGMALVVENELIGTAIMAMGKGAPAVSKELLRSFSHIASVSLRRRQAEFQLVASEEKFKKLFYISPDSIILSRLDDGKIVSVNKGFAKIMNYEEGEVLGRTTAGTGIFQDPEKHDQIRAALRSKGLVDNVECRFVGKSGKNVMGLVSAVIIDINGEKYVMTTIRDVSEHKRANDALRLSEETFRRTFEAIPDPAYVWTRGGDGRILLNKFNQAALQITRNKIKDYVGIEPEKLFFADPDFTEKIILAMNAGTPHSGETLYTFQSTGLSKWLQVDYVRTAADNVLVITKDVSERKEAEAKLLAYQEQLRALTLELTLVEERERRRIAAELHDQIGQNLALCKLKVAALEKGMSRERVKSELSALRRLLEVSIQGARSLVFDLSPPVLYELGFQAALEWLAEWIGEQYQIPVEFESRGGGEILEADRQVILFQVVRELLVNVGKHSQASRAKVILSLEERSLHIQVNDDGRGFDASQIYDAKVQKGGFGFFSMRERLNYLGGGIDVKSKPGQGTQIVLTVPQGTPPTAGKKEDA